jgi:heptaprenyl diphosphate synthase
MVRLHAATFERLCLGQLHETTGPQKGADAIAHYLQVLADKTGSLIASSAVVGLMTSGAPREYFEPLREYGEKIGVAFQIIDDVLDLDGGETGKEKGNDVRNGVATLPILLARAATDAESVSLVARIDAAIEANDPDTFAGLMDELRGSRHTVETIASARRWATEAVEALEILPDGLPKKSLARFASRVIDRTN